MSKLAKQLQTHSTGVSRTVEAPSYLTVTTHCTQVPFQVEKEFSIQAKFQANFFIDDEKKVGEASKSLRRAIVEQIFGEFRPLIIEMQSALYHKDRDRLRHLIAELEHKMFVEDL